MLQMVRNIILTGVAMLAVSGCDRIDFKGFFAPTGDVVQKRFEQSMDITGNKAVDGVETNEEYILYVCTDPHIDASADNLQKFNDALRADSDAALGIILGDCIDQKDRYKEYLAATEYDQAKHSYKSLWKIIDCFSHCGEFKSFLNATPDILNQSGRARL